MKYMLTVLMISTAVISLTPALANDPDTDVITVAGLRAQSPEEVTASVSVLDEAQLALRDAPFLADSLRSVPGLGVSRSGAYGGLTQVRLRGAEANHTFVLIDGIEASDPTTGETDFGLWSGLQATRIEVARGEQSALYGSDAIGGVISVTTGGEGLRAGMEAGSRQTARGYLSAEQGFEGFSLGGALSAFTTEGVDTSGGSGEEDGSDNYAGLLRGSAELGEGWEARALIRVAQSAVESDADTDFDGRLNDTLRETETDQRLGGITVKGPAFGLDHQFRASFAEVIRENTANGTFTDETTGERLKFSYSPSKAWESDRVSHRLTGLIDHEKEDYKRADTDTLFGDPNQSQSIETLGLAGEYQLSAGNLTVNASARHDNNDGLFEDATTWRVGAVYRAGELGRFRISAGEGVKNPTFTELFGFFPGSFVGNPDLNPESSRSIELGWDKTFSRGQLSATIYHATLEDEIFTAFTPDFSSSTALNREGESERQGIELSGNVALTDTIALYASGAMISSENDTRQDEIRVPEWTGHLGARWESPRKPGLTIAGALDMVGKQDDFDFGSFPARRLTLDSYVLASATIAYPVTDKVSVTLRGENLFDEEVTDVVGFTQPGAGLFVGLRFD